MFQPVLHTISHTILHTILQAWLFFLHTIWQDVDRGQGGRPQREGGGLLSDGLGGVGGQPAKGLGDLGGEPAAEEVLYISTPTRSPRHGPPAKGLGEAGER